MNGRKRKPKASKAPGKLRYVVAANLRDAMELLLSEHGDKVKSLSKSSGVARSTVQRILNAEFSANIDTLDAIARALKVAPAMLLAPRRGGRR